MAAIVQFLLQKVKKKCLIPTKGITQSSIKGKAVFKYTVLQHLYVTLKPDIELVWLHDMFDCMILYDIDCMILYWLYWLYDHWRTIKCKMLSWLLINVCWRKRIISTLKCQKGSFVITNEDNPCNDIYIPSVGFI